MLALEDKEMLDLDECSAGLVVQLFIAQIKCTHYLRFFTSIIFGNEYSVYTMNIVLLHVGVYTMSVCCYFTLFCNN